MKNVMILESKFILLLLYSNNYKTSSMYFFNF